MSAPRISAKRAETLAALWEQGIPSKQIADKVGGGITAAGVDAEARQLGLPERRKHWDSKMSKIIYKPDGKAPAQAPGGEFDMPDRPQGDSRR